MNEAAELKAFDVTVMSYNCLTTTKQPISDKNPDTGKDRGEMLIDCLLTYMPDSIGLQEVTYEWKSYIEENILGKKLMNGAVYEMTGIVSDAGTVLLAGVCEFVPILYRADKYDKVREGGRWFSDTPEVKSKFGPMTDETGEYNEGLQYDRVYGYVVLKDRETGDTYIHVNTHPDHKSGKSINEMCMRQMYEYLNGLRNRYGCPVAATGDYNFDESLDAYKIMADSANGFTNAKYLTDNHSRLSSFCGYGENFKSKEMYLREEYVIDHVFVSTGNVGAYKHEIIEDKWFSDHSAVLVNLRMNSRACITGLYVNGKKIKGFAPDRFYYEAETGENAEFTVEAPENMVVSAEGKIVKPKCSTTGKYVNTDNRKRLYFTVTDEDGSKKAYCVTGK